MTAEDPADRPTMLQIMQEMDARLASLYKQDPDKALSYMACDNAMMPAHRERGAIPDEPVPHTEALDELATHEQSLAV